GKISKDFQANVRLRTMKFLHTVWVIFTLNSQKRAQNPLAISAFATLTTSRFNRSRRHMSCTSLDGAEIRVMISHFRSLNAVIVVRTVTTIGDADVLCIAFLYKKLFWLVGERK